MIASHHLHQAAVLQGSHSVYTLEGLLEAQLGKHLKAQDYLVDQLEALREKNEQLERLSEADDFAHKIVWSTTNCDKKLEQLRSKLAAAEDVHCFVGTTKRQGHQLVLQDASLPCYRYTEPPIIVRSLKHTLRLCDIGNGGRSDLGDVAWVEVVGVGKTVAERQERKRHVLKGTIGRFD
ncbi:hypothetical protein MNV49_007457 [Pseudohyphozyma bogoriensis]|nr:hypothetical protein MNV49_007457 [Pseudohyphozyma bogoriensis]